MNSWHMITSGHLTRNKFWGEDEDKTYHPCIATSTVIQTGQHNILVDPCKNAEEMKIEIYTKCGLKAEDIDIVYSTHKHFDHWMGLDAFPDAEFYMASGDLKSLQRHIDVMKEKDAKIIRRAKPAQGQLIDGISLIPLPGHTLGLQGLLFEAPEGKILISGDSVMTYEFFQAKEGYFFSVSQELSKKSIEKASEIADYIIPGHGNYFSVKAYPFKEKAAEKMEVVYADEDGKIGLNTALSEIFKIDGAMNLLVEYFDNKMPASDIVVYEDTPLGVFVKSLSMEEKKAVKMLADLNKKQER